MLSEYVTEENAGTTANSVNRILDALWEMLSGVCRRHAIACYEVAGVAGATGLIVQISRSFFQNPELDEKFSSNSR